MTFKKIFFIVCAVLCSKLAVADYKIPKGIPDPSDYFGVLDPIDDKAPTVNPDGTCSACPNWPVNESTGCYFVDNTDNDCSDATNGYPDQPRCTIPEGTLNAGDFVYIAGGGTYTAAGQGFDWAGTGTASDPIWITGDPENPPLFNESIMMPQTASASYIIVQHWRMSGEYNRTQLQSTVDGYDTDHIVFRHFTMNGTDNSPTDYTALLVGWSEGKDDEPNSTVEYTVVYDGTISQYGDDTGEEAGVLTGWHTDYTWVLNCDINDVGADAIAGSHFSGRDSYKTEHYYIGGNTCYGNGENGIDIKAARYVIISENTIWGPFAREQGWGIVLHYGDDSFTPKTPVSDAWVIFNTIYHVSGGIYTSDAKNEGCDNLNIIGNLIYDIDSSYAVYADPRNGYAIRAEGGDGTHRVVDNTIYDYEKGVLVNDLEESDFAYIHGNLLHTRTRADSYDIEIVTGQTRVNMDRNQIYPLIEAPSFFWNGADRTLSYMQTTESECVYCRDTDPELVRPDASNFKLKPGSPCRNGSVKGPVGDNAYDAFLSFFGVDIEYDYNGFSRPQEDLWDIGAFEYINQDMCSAMYLLLL